MKTVDMGLSLLQSLQSAESSFHESISHVYEGQSGCHMSANGDGSIGLSSLAWQMSKLILESLFFSEEITVDRDATS